MSELKSQRGRPKGSGIDDRAVLREIAGLINADPSLKPTTTIRSIGVADPSVIRRLRDKFQQCRAELMTELSSPPAAPAGLPTDRTSTQAQPALPRSIPAKSAAAVRKSGRVVPSIAVPVIPNGDVTSAAEQDPSTPAPAAVTGTDAPVETNASDWMTGWLGVGMALATTTARAQLTMMHQLMRSGPLAFALTSQVALNEFVLSVAPSGRRTVH